MSDNMTVRSQAKLKPVFIGRQWFHIIFPFKIPIKLDNSF